MGLCYPGFFPVKNQKSHPKKGRKHTTCRTSRKLGRVWEKLPNGHGNFAGFLRNIAFDTYVPKACSCPPTIGDKKVTNSGCQCERSLKSNIHKLIKLEVSGWSLAYQRIVVIFLYLLTYPRLVQVESSIRNGMHGARGITSIIQKRPSIQSTKLYAKFANHSTKDQLKLQIHGQLFKKSIYFGRKFRSVCRFLGHSITPPPPPKKRGGAPRIMHDLPIHRSSDDNQAPVTLLARGS